jgi:hypothetical protein
VAPQQPNKSGESSREAQLYAVGSLLVAVFGAIVLGLGFMMYPPCQPLGFGLGGLALGVGGTHLRRALSRSDDRIDTARAPHGGPTTGADPVETLKVRCARGELTDEEFERLLDQLVALDSIEDAGTGEPSRDAAGIPDR